MRLSVNSSKRSSDGYTRQVSTIDYQGYTRTQRDEAKHHFLSTQINDFMLLRESQCQTTSQSLMSVRTKTNEKHRAQSNAMELRTFFYNLQVQKQILEDQQRLHEYQTKIFQKQLKQRELAPATPQSDDSRHPMITDHIHFIDDDITTLVDFFRKRQLLKRMFKRLKRQTQTRERAIIQYKILCKTFYALARNAKQSVIARKERQRMEMICESLRY